MTDTTYLLHDPDDGWQEYQDLDAAESAFEYVVHTMRSDAEYDSEWHGDVETVGLYQARRVLGVRLVEAGAPAMDLEVIDERKTTDPLTGEASPIAAVPAHLASQEGCDGEPWDQMQAVADEIRRLSAEVERLRWALTRQQDNYWHTVTVGQERMNAVVTEGDTATLMLAAVRARAEKDGLQAILDVLDQRPMPGPVPGYIAVPVIPTEKS